MSSINVAVIGAGVVGLTTALELKKQIPQANVSIIADQFFNDTASYATSGLFFPELINSTLPEEIRKSWTEVSYNYWNNIRRSPDAAKVGITLISGYVLSSSTSEIVINDYLKELLPLYRSVTEDEFYLCPGNWKDGTFLTTLLIDCGQYLPWAFKQIQKDGGQIIKQSVKDLQEISPKYDVIINCSGLGSKTLCKDDAVQPIREQILRVEAPWMKMFFVADKDTYVIPGFGGVTLGGEQQFGSSKLDVNVLDSNLIKCKCEKLVPSLNGSRVIEQTASVRCYRPTVRVEKEILSIEENRKLKIVHNYGHGNDSIIMAPAAALAAVKLAKELCIEFLITKLAI